MTVTQIMVLLNQTVIEGFKGGISDQLKSDGWKLRGLSLQRGFFDFHNKY